MTVGIITHTFPDENLDTSGIANHFNLLAEGLSELDHKVVVLHFKFSSLKQEVENRYINKNIRIEIHHIYINDNITRVFLKRWSFIEFYKRWRQLLYVYFKINNLVKKYNLDIIETSSFYSLCFLPIFFKSTKIPIVIRVSTLYRQVIDNYLPVKSQLLKKIADLELEMIRRSNFLITHSKHHQAEIAGYFKEKLDFFIIPHGINIPINSNKKSTSTKKRVLFVGRIEHRKGIDILLKAIPHVFKNIQSEVEFIIIGKDESGYFENNFIHDESLIEVSKNIKYLGALTDEELNNHYSECDILVVPSRYESFGLIIVEAMSYSKPVVCFEVGGIREIVIHGYNGLFAEFENATEFADHIVFLLENEKTCIEMGQNARATVLNSFSKERLAQASLNHYVHVINEFNSKK